MSEKYLAIYKKFINGRLPHIVKNKYREVEDDLTQYSFMLDGHLIFSYDVCGGCEAHAILTAMHRGATSGAPPNATATTATTTATADKVSAGTNGLIVSAVRTAGLLKDLSATQRKANIALKYCPTFN
jgi:hypothetical protein